MGKYFKTNRLKYKIFNTFAIQKKESLLEFVKKGQQGRKKSAPVSNFFRKIKRFFRGGIRFRPEPKEYRPYLGPQASEEEVMAKTYESSDHPDKIRKIIRREKRRRLLRLFDIKEVQAILEKRRYERMRRKYKRKLKRRVRREERRDKRIELIRRYIPSYKRGGGLLTFDEPDDAASESKKFRVQNNLTYLTNSTFLFIIAYILVYMIYQITVLFIAAGWRLDSVLFYYDLAFNDFSPLWYRTNIIITTFSGPLVSLIIGFIFIRFLSGKANLGKHTRLFFLWIGLHGFTLFLGAFASGVSFDEGFGYVAAWLYMNMFWKILISLIFLFLLGVIGYFTATRFLDTSYSLMRIKPQNSFKFLLYQAVLPWLIGTAIILLVKIPNNLPYETGNLIVFGFAVIPILFNRKSRPSRNFVSEKRPNQIKWFVLIAMVLLLMIYRIGLNDGLHIKLFYRFSFSLDISPL
jgi:hypothetical protein